MLKEVLLLCIVAACYGGRINIRKAGNRFTDTRIIGGSNADIKDFPHQISMSYGGGFLCGGSIIGDRLVLTAGHCTNGLESPTKYLKIHSGSTTLLSGTKHDVEKVYDHPKWNEDLDYDVALIQVVQPFTLSDTTQIIKVGTDEPINGTVVYSGWGLKHESDWDSPEHLQTVEVPVVPRDKCNDEYLEEFGGITERMWCAGVKGKGPCYGDSGGAILQDEKVVGIVSWGGHGCAKDGYPAVNTNVANSEIQKFINDVLQNL